MSLKLSSDAFSSNSAIPDRHAKEGGNISPALSWSGVGPEIRSLALIVDDPDAPSGTFVHWLVYGIAPTATGFAENMPNTESLHAGVRQGRNGNGELGYAGPKPPSGTHRYVFHLFALDTEFNLPPGASRHELDAALRGHVVEEAQLVGTYQHHEAHEAGARVA